ncbi:hypothetical protein [Micromonospora aurantiaca (nom. illeg.)]|uniref:hypothetical protein n=1 Tax=Micromonospora aurantiaca (nom. illeg.) TaxID=47850 RepID=UPI0033E39BF9
MGYDVTVRRFGLYAAVAAMLLTADRTLRRKFQVLTMAAGRKDVEVRSIKPKLEYAEAIVKVASDTGDLESAVDKLEPDCGRYW